MLHAFAVLFTVYMAYSIIKCDAYDKPLFAILYVVTIYYGYMAPLYWIEMELGHFLGVDWSSDINYSCYIVMGGSVFFTLFVRIWNWIGIILNDGHVKKIKDEAYIYPGKKIKVLMGLACVGMLYVLIFAVFAGGINPDDPALKIAYQFGDLAIPVILYIIGYFGMGVYQIVLIVLFMAYSITLGFRYKLVIFFMPMVISYVFKKFKTKGFSAGILSIAKSGVFGIFLLALFSLMTITRQKFGGLDLSAVGDQSSNDVMYGFFAEGNTIFALTSIIVNFVDMDKYYYMQPVLDALLDLVPRFIVPWRNTAQYADDVLIGLLVPEARLSGTAYPYIGELLLMYGYSAVIIGLILVTGLYAAIKNSLIASVSPIGVKYIGIGLLAVFFGYYYFSRGYFSQSLKGFLFLVLPYCYLLSRSGSKNEK